MGIRVQGLIHIYSKNLIMIIEYKIYTGFKADALANTSDDTMSVLAPSPK